MDNLQDTRSLLTWVHIFVEIRPYPSLSADITEYLAILSVSRMVLIPRKQVAENQKFLLVTVKYYYLTSVTKKEEGIAGCIEVVIDSNIADTVLRKGEIGVKSCQSGISTKTG